MVRGGGLWLVNNHGVDSNIPKMVTPQRELVEGLCSESKWCMCMGKIGRDRRRLTSLAHSKGPVSNSEGRGNIKERRRSETTGEVLYCYFVGLIFTLGLIELMCCCAPICLSCLGTMAMI